MIRGIEFLDNPEYKYYRKLLFKHLKKNDFIYPVQSQMKHLFGVSNRYMDRALGLGRNVTNQHRIDIIKKVFKINAHTVRKIYKRY